MEAVKVLKGFCIVVIDRGFVYVGNTKKADQSRRARGGSEMRRYANAKECMEKVTTRKRVCSFGLVRCECESAMECPAKREVDRLMDERTSRDTCGREDRCEWKREYLRGHISMKQALDKVRSERDKLKLREKILRSWIPRDRVDAANAEIRECEKAGYWSDAAAGRGEGKLSEGDFDEQHGGV